MKLRTSSRTSDLRGAQKQGVRMTDFFRGDDGIEYMIISKTHSSPADVTTLYSLVELVGGKQREFTSSEWASCELNPRR